MSDIYKIKPANFEGLREKIAKLNKKAVKLGCEPATITVLGEEMVKATKVMPGGNILKYGYKVLFVIVTGDTPKLEGWSLIAKVEYIENERMMLCVPGETCPEEFRTRGIECDHCRSDRQRKNVFVLRHEDGRHVQVGRTCIKDFLGGVSPEQLLSQATWSFNVVEACGEYEGGCGRYAPEAINIVEYLNGVAICIRRLGWVSRKAARLDESSTATDAWNLIKPNLRTEKDRADYNKWVEKKNLYHQERDEKLAAVSLAWAVNQPVEGVVDYFYNLGVACRAGYVTRKTAGIIASVISAYPRHVEREAEIRQEKTTKSHEWVGEVKVRQDFEKLTVLKMSSFDGRYGTTTLITFEDEPGNLIKWFASVNLDDVDKGDVIDLKATVKKHDSYNGVKETVITRAKILKINGEVI